MKKSVILFGISSLLFLGCGSGGGSSSSSSQFSSVDNIALMDGKNTYGSYGEKVKWGNHTLARRWTFTKAGESDFNLIFSTGQEGYHVEGLDVNAITYGISQNGREVNFVLLANHITARLDSVVDDKCYMMTLTNTDTNAASNAKVCAE